MTVIIHMNERHRRVELHRTQPHGRRSQRHQLRLPSLRQSGHGSRGVLPALPGNLDNWDPALVDDIAAEREVILVNASGVASSTGTTPTSFQGFGRDAIAFIDALDITQVDLFGFSIGGYVAQEVALQRPNLVRRLILAGTGPQGGREMHGWTELPTAHAMKDVQGAEDIYYLFFSPSDASQAKGQEFVGRIFTRTENRDADVALTARDAQYGALLAGHIPNARLSIYPDANHGFLFQYPREFAAEVNAFLSE